MANHSLPFRLAVGRTHCGPPSRPTTAAIMGCVAPVPLGRCCLLLWVTVCGSPAEQLPGAVFSARDGLHTTVPRIVADSRGFVWFPGSEGLVRFDGNGFRAFSLAEGLPASSVSDIAERRDGTYWVAANEHLCLFNPSPYQRRFDCESPKLGVINTLVEGERGLWCGTERGLWRRLESGRFVRVVTPPAGGLSTAVFRLLKDARGDVWAAAYSGLYRFRSDGRIDHWTRTSGLVIDSNTALAETPGAIWVGTQTGLLQFRVDPKTGEAEIAARHGRSQGLPSNYTVDVRSWRGEVWAATFQGLARQLPSGRWQPVDLEPSLRELPLETLATDRLGNLWVGTDGGGAQRISGSGLTIFSEREGLGMRKVWAVFEDGSAGLMAVTKDERQYFLNRFDGYRFHAIKPNLRSGSAWGWSWSQIAVHSRSGDWWLATGSGLLRYRHGLGAPPEVGLRGSNVFRIFEDSRGALWVSVNEILQNRLYRREPATGRFERFDESQGLPPLREDGNCPAVFAEDRAGQVWIGMLDRGLVRFRGGRFESFPPSSGAPDQGVRALLIDRQGRLWIGSRRRGLLRVDDPSAAHPVFSACAKASELSSDTVLALAEDLAGRIYAARARGIDRLDPATGRVRHLTATGELPPGELRAACRDRRGALWFGGDSGLVRIEPQEDRAEPLAVLVYSIRVNGRNRPVSDVGEAEPPPLSLSPAERQVQVDFGGFFHDLRYQTRLSGVDRDWTPPSGSRSLHYLSLAPGRYELLIRAVAPDRRLSSRPARVRFRIAAPVWQRWWFVLLSAAAGAGLAYAVRRYRVAQAVALERIRTRIASDLHDDIGSSLSQIAILSEVARRQAGEADPRVTEALHRIAAVSREMVDSLSDTVWAINPQKDHVADLTQRMRRFAGELLEARDIRLEFRAPGPDADLPLDAETRREVFLIFKEAIHNLARHSGCSEAEVGLEVREGELVLAVRDNGCGFDARQAENGYGLANMRSRAGRLGGRLELSTGGGLTALRLHVPLARRTPLRKRVGPRPGRLG